MTALRALWPGAAALGLVGLVVGGALWALLGAAEPGTLGRILVGDYVLGLLRFTIIQAALSALLSVGLAVPVARALARRQDMPGRALLLRLLGLPMIMPVIVAVLGIVAIWGRSGLVNDGLAAIGIELRLDIYGLAGILIAHVFLNMPFATRLLLQGWATIPGESWRLAAQLGMSSGQMFRLIEWPMVRGVAPGLAGLIFLLCFASFAVVLVLGGGPPNATLEVALYQALKFDVDIPRAVALAALQVAVAGVIAALGLAVMRRAPVEPVLGRLVTRHDTASALGRLGDAMAIAVGLLILLLPMAAIVVAGIAGPWGQVLGRRSLWAATGWSLGIGAAAGGLALVLGWGIVVSARALHAGWWRRRMAESFELVGSLTLVLPPFVIGAGLFVLMYRGGLARDFGVVAVVLVNAMMGLPFVIRILAPPATEVALRHRRLADSLGMSGWQRFRLIDWPLLRRPAGLALAMAVTLAAGDFGVIALFGSTGLTTLSLELYQLMGAYRMDEAAVVAVILILLSFMVFAGLERGIGGTWR